jgi:hypothetical protein
MEAIPIKWYVICSLLLYFLSGMSFYLLDMRLGVKFQSWRYKVTHKGPLPAGQEFGFLYNRRYTVKFWWAGILTLFISLGFILVMHTNPVVGVFTWVFDVVMTFLGIVCGPLAYRVWTGRQATLKRMDEIQESIKSGELREDVRQGIHETAEDLKDLGHQAAEAASKKGAELVGAVRGKIDDGVEAVTGRRPVTPPPANPENKPSSPPATPVERPEDLQAMVDNFTRKGK